jgi:hypothetical protein
MSAGQVLNSSSNSRHSTLFPRQKSRKAQIATASMRPPAILASSVKVQMWQCLCNDCRLKALTLCRRGVEMQSDSHLDLVTATLARPDMTDFVVAHVCRRLWRDQWVIAFAARHSRARAIVHPRGHMTTSLMLLASYGVET